MYRDRWYQYAIVSPLSGFWNLESGDFDVSAFLFLFATIRIISPEAERPPQSLGYHSDVSIVMAANIV